MKLPRKFEFIHRSGDGIYIADLDQETLVISPEYPRYDRYKDRVWHGYPESLVGKFIAEGTWLFRKDLTIEETVVEVGDLL